MLRLLRQASDPTSDRFIFTHICAVKARGLYDYPGGSADELPFSEGDVISVVDRSDSDWYKAEKDGVIFIVPAAYLEIEG
jgi:actin cytoskeleton-regulatory complex protein PAN1